MMRKALLLACCLAGFAANGLFAQSPAATDAIETVELVEPNFDEVLFIDDVLDLEPAWSYSPDAPKPERKPLDRDVVVDLPIYTSSLAFSSDPYAVVGALEIMKMNRSDGDQSSLSEEWILHRYKSTTGQKSSPLPLYRKVQDARSIKRDFSRDRNRLSLRSGSLLSIGPDGKMAVIKTSDAGRLDVWSLQGRGKHVVAFKPYGKDEGFGTNVFWAASLSPEILLTLNHAGKLVRWKLPECKALYERDLGDVASYESWPGLGVYVPPGLSPNHRHLAVWSGTSLMLIDTLSGKTLGVLGGTRHRGWLQPTFHWDGTQIACTEVDNLNQVLVIHDLVTGAELLRLPLPGDIWDRPGSSETTHGGFTWVDERHGVVSGKLMIDLDKGQPIWRFNSSMENQMVGPKLFTRPGPEFWYRGNKLNAVKLPHAEALEFGGKVPDFFAARPGSRINVETDIDAPDDVREALVSAIQSRVKQLGMEVGSDERVTLKIETEVRDAGEDAVVRSLVGRFLLPSGEPEQVKLNVIILRVAFLVDGKEVWSRSVDYLPSRNASWVDDPNKTTQQELLDYQWEQARNNSSSLISRIPGYVLDPKAQSEFPFSPYPVPKAGKH